MARNPLCGFFNFKNYVEIATNQSEGKESAIQDVHIRSYQINRQVKQCDKQFKGVGYAFLPFDIHHKRFTLIISMGVKM